jgi:hypothetical protein
LAVGELLGDLVSAGTALDSDSDAGGNAAEHRDKAKA